MSSLDARNDFAQYQLVCFVAPLQYALNFKAARITCSIMFFFLIQGLGDKNSDIYTLLLLYDKICYGLRQIFLVPLVLPVVFAY
jgi:hypothetical protein